MTDGWSRKLASDLVHSPGSFAGAFFSQWPRLSAPKVPLYQAGACFCFPWGKERPRLKPHSQTVQTSDRVNCNTPRSSSTSEIGSPSGMCFIFEQRIMAGGAKLTIRGPPYLRLRAEEQFRSNAAAEKVLDVAFLKAAFFRAIAL
jgi:hypothetical protein